ncbi:MAG: repeat-containing protein [Pedosphaera sp.]|nr:repeat-containing protein [Pedosphaera sp.]
MKGKRARIVLALAVVAFVGGVVWLELQPKEPVYERKGLSEWLEDYINLPPDELEKANQAVRHIGTNAVPTLLRYLQAKDSPLTDRLFALAQKQHFIKVYHISARERQFEGALGFRGLGAKAKDAIPLLRKLYEDATPEGRARIAWALGEIGPEAKSTIPLLLRALGDANVELRASAAHALGGIHAEPELAVPALIQCLQSQNRDLPRIAADALGKFGADAQPAVPALVQLLNRKDSEIQMAGSRALRLIDSETAAKAGVQLKKEP